MYYNVVGIASIGLGLKCKYVNCCTSFDNDLQDDKHVTDKEDQRRGLSNHPTDRRGLARPNHPTDKYHQEISSNYGCMVLWRADYIQQSTALDNHLQQRAALALSLKDNRGY